MDTLYRSHPLFTLRSSSIKEMIDAQNNNLMHYRRILRSRLFPKPEYILRRKIISTAITP